MRSKKIPFRSVLFERIIRVFDQSISREIRQ